MQSSSLSVVKVNGITHAAPLMLVTSRSSRYRTVEPPSQSTHLLPTHLPVYPPTRLPKVYWSLGVRDVSPEKPYCLPIGKRFRGLDGYQLKVEECGA
jgi:hypothetical protein